MKELKLKLASLQRKDMILQLKQERLMIKGEKTGRITLLNWQNCK